MIQNFENNSENVYLYTPRPVLGVPTKKRTSEDFYEGTASLKVVTPGLALTEGVFWQIPSKPNVMTRLSMAFKAPAGAWMTFETDFYNAPAFTGDFDTGWISNVVQHFHATGDWQILEMESLAPANTQSVQMYIFTSWDTGAVPQAITFYLDELAHNYLIAEEEPTDAELTFMDESPPGFFPENQDSAFGIKRKIFSDQMQEGSDQLTEIYRERFVPTSDTYLDEWEKMVGLPSAPTGVDDVTRQSRILGRLRQGPFSMSRRREIVEKYIAATSGSLAVIGSGIPILGGIPLHAGPVTDVTELYRIYETVTNYSFEIWLDSTVTVDQAAMQRELDYIVPSGISYTIDNTHTGTGLINWGKTVTHFAPTFWFRLDSGTGFAIDSSGNGYVGTLNGAPTAIAAPGLIASAGSNGAADFSGSGQDINVAENSTANSRLFTWHITVRPDAMPASGSSMTAMSHGGNAIQIYNNAGSNVWRIAIIVDSVQYVYEGTSHPTVGTIYDLEMVFDASHVRLYVNGALEIEQAVSGLSYESGAGGYKIGSYFGALYWNGGLDEALLFGYPMNQDQITRLHEAARNIL